MTFNIFGQTNHEHAIFGRHHSRNASTSQSQRTNPRDPESVLTPKELKAGRDRIAAANIADHAFTFASNY
jgi:hypothetical protein